MTVLIPTSGRGSRLGDLTEYLNKALVPVGDKAVISHIIDLYPADTEFLIMLGYKGDIVREYLTLAHPDTNFTWLDIELTEGDLCLVSALHYYKDLLQRPFMFHSCDTICTPPFEAIDIMRTEVDNMLFVSSTKPFNTHDYRTVTTKTSPVYEKGAVLYEDTRAVLGVTWFRDYEAFWNAVEKICSTQDPCASPPVNDMDIVNAMIAHGSPFTQVALSEWSDTGNMTMLRQAREQYKGEVVMEKYDQAVYLLEDRVIKFFSDPDMVRKRVERAKLLGDAVPTIIASTEHCFSYEKVHGTLARDTMHSRSFLEFLDWCKTNLWQDTVEVSYEDWGKQVHEFYINKTWTRLRNFWDKTGGCDQSEIINGYELPRIEDLFSCINWESVFQNGAPAPAFHGDLHPSNIFITDDGFKLIDWREGFGSQSDWGDVYYDLGKILHGLIVSHDLISENAFFVNEDIGETPVVVTFDFQRHHRFVLCEEDLKKWCFINDFDFRVVQLMCALIFLNIAALHHDPYSRLLFYLGKSMLAELLS